MPDPILRCSFCNKAQAEVRKLIAGPAVFICDECVGICTDIIRSDQELPPRSIVPPADPKSVSPTAVVTCRLCGLQVLQAETLVIEGRGQVCVACCGEVEASIAGQREGVSGDD